MLQRLLPKENETINIWHVVLLYKCWSSVTSAQSVKS
jgi:hypothetical protein